MREPDLSLFGTARAAPGPARRGIGRRIIPVLILAIALLASGCGASLEAARPTAAPTPATPTPEAVLRLRSAEDFELVRQAGQPVVLAILDEGYG